jgi:hypothetical protein
MSPDAVLASTARRVPAQSTPPCSKKRRSSTAMSAAIIAGATSSAVTSSRSWANTWAIGVPRLSVIVVVCGSEPVMSSVDSPLRVSLAWLAASPAPAASG